MVLTAGIVIAGGRSRRLGIDKRRLRLRGSSGPTLLEHTLTVLAPLCAELVAVLNDASAWPGLPARLVGDQYADGGALGGLYAGLSAVSSPYALVVAADMPLLNTALLRAMLAAPRSYEALVPRFPLPGRPLAASPQPHPLHAVYSRACLPVLRRALDDGMRRSTDFLALIHTVYIEPPDIARYDPSGYSFLNINTPADLAWFQQYSGR